MICTVCGESKTCSSCKREEKTKTIRALARALLRDGSPETKNRQWNEWCKLVNEEMGGTNDL